MSQITPFVKRMRTQGGTLYTFSSAVEDIGININERTNKVEMSNFALLSIPTITAPSVTDPILANKFNPYAMPNSLENFKDSEENIKDGRVVVAESFQNYALNLETNLLAATDYNPSLLHTVSERVFWKWLKESGAIRWRKDSEDTYYQEEIDSDVSTAYNSVVKYIGEISAGSVRTDTFGTYNETYVILPTSHGQTDVWFKQRYDDNYTTGMEIGRGGVNIYGREDYTKPHPDGLSFIADYDVIDSSITGYEFTDVSIGEGYTSGFWWEKQGKSISTSRWYVTDLSAGIIDDSSTLNYDIFYSDATFPGGSAPINFRRSNVDALGIEFDINNLRTLVNPPDPTLTYDKLAIADATDDSFTFNAILLYYKVWDPTKDKLLATNLLGILFLDAASGTTAGFPAMEINIPLITKYQSTNAGFGSSYSFRVNIKSDNMIDDTAAVIHDESTSSQLNVQNWGGAFDKLSKSLTILNQHTGTVNYITEQYLTISSTQTQQANSLSDLQYQVNDVVTDITGTNNVIAMFKDGDDPIVDSSIYMRYGKVGVFTNNPQYPFHVDASMKTKDITIENAIRDTSGNILLGYGSPLQLGSSTNYRNVDIYTGGNNALISCSSLNFVTIDSSLTVNGRTKLLSNTTITGDTSIVGIMNITGDTTITGDAVISGGLTVDGVITGDVSTTIQGYVLDASLGIWPDGSLYWNAQGLLDVSTAGGGATQDGSIWVINNVDNRILTATGTGGLQGEPNFIFTGSTLTVTGNQNLNGNLIVTGSETVTGASSDYNFTGRQFDIYDQTSGEAVFEVYPDSGIIWIGDVNSAWASTGAVLEISPSEGTMSYDGVATFPSITSTTHLKIKPANTYDVSIHGGDHSGGAGGDVYIQGGNTNNGSGGVYILGSTNTSGTGGGDVHIRGGVHSATPGTVPGNIYFGASDTSAIYSHIGAIPTGTAVSNEILFIDQNDSYKIKRTTGAIAVTTFTNGVNNRVVTAGSATGINGEVSMTFDTTARLFAVDGSITATNEITAYSSDRRLKKNITNIEDPLIKLNQINGVTFNWNDNVADLGFVPNAETEVGMIAQELQAIFPDAVAAAPFDMKDGKSISGENYLTTKPHKIIPLLVEAVKELSERVIELENIIKDLK
jgi:hypothetical protein